MNWNQGQRDNRLGDYKEVADRIAEFYEKYPEGALRAIIEPRVEVIDGRAFVVYGAGAFKHRDNPHPDGIGYAWEPVPGKTNFTRDSELMNAETSAWGRAVVALGILAKGEKIASANEVRAREDGGGETPKGQAAPPKGAAILNEPSDAPHAGELTERGLCRKLADSLPAETQAADRAGARWKAAEKRTKDIHEGFKAAFKELSDIHETVCGKDCEHITAARAEAQKFEQKEAA